MNRIERLRELLAESESGNAPVKPTIAELEELLRESSVLVNINPDGSIGAGEITARVAVDDLAALLAVAEAAKELRREFENLYDGPEHPLNSLAAEMTALHHALSPLLAEAE